MFDKAFDRVIGHEGGYTDDPHDRGNWTSGKCGNGECKGTKFGLAAMTYPTLDIKNLTVNQAKAIYYEDWWLQNNLDAYHPSIGYQLFDAAINHGMRNAAKFLQRAVGVVDDGIIGSKTMTAVNSMPADTLLKLFLAERLQFFTEIKTFDRYGRGWSRRVVQNLKYAAEDIT